MDFQVKLYNWQDQGNHVIVVGRGPIDSSAFRMLFDRIEAASQHLCDCKVLVDLSDSSYLIDGDEIQAFVARLPLSHWPQGHKIAFVSGPDISDYHRLFFLRTELVARHLSVGVFRNSRVAIDWLAGIF